MLKTHLPQKRHPEMDMHGRRGLHTQLPNVLLLSLWLGLENEELAYKYLR